MVIYSGLKMIDICTAGGPAEIYTSISYKFKFKAPKAASHHSLIAAVIKTCHHSLGFSFFSTPT